MVEQLLPSIILNIDGQKYVFNVPDNFQRFRQDQFIGQCKSGKYFFTRLSPESLSGFYCLIINLYTGNNGIGSKIYGPPLISRLFNILRGNVVVNNYLLQFSSYSFFSRESMLGLTNSKHFEQIKENQQYQLQKNDESIKNFVNEQKQINDASQFIKENKYFQDENLTVIPIQMTQTNSILSYILQTKEVPRKIDQEKLNSYNIPKQKLQILFKQGQYEFDDGVILKLDEVQLEQEKSQLILIIDCPEPKYIEYLLNSQELKSFQKQKYSEEAIFIHMTPLEVVQSPLYSEFLANFSDKFQHIFCDHRLKENLSQDEQAIQNKQYKHFSLLQEQHKQFPDLFTQFEEYQDRSINFVKVSYLNDTLPQIVNKIISKKYYEFILNPKSRYGYKCSPLFLLKDNTIETSEIFKEKYDEYKTQKSDIQKDELSLDYDPLIVILGTGSMMPTAYRNVSANLILFNDFSCLLDCGEGTYSQIYDKYGKQTDEQLKKIKYVVISHYHEDHHMGLQYLLHKRNQITDEKIFIILPLNTIVFYELIKQFYQQKWQNCKFITIQQLISTKGLNEDFCFINSKFVQKELDSQIKDQLLIDFDAKQVIQDLQQNHKLYLESIEMDQIELNFCPVQHCPQSFGTAIQNKKTNIKISYSGDLRPSKSFIDLIENSNILIHEATFNDDLHQLAKRNMHSTIQEAIQTAIQSNSKNLVLTHFSQRYAKGTYCCENTRSEAQNTYFDQQTIFGFDQMSFRISQCNQVVKESKLASFMLPE